MANRRNLKKDIDFLIYEVISDCYTYKRLFDDNNQNDVDKIIDEAMALRYELVMRVNHPDGKENKKLVKAFYKKIYKDLLTKVDDFFSRLNSLLSKTQNTEEKTTTKKPVKEEKVQEDKAKEVK